MEIHHIGYLVKKINKAIIAFEEMGYKQERDVVFDEYRRIDICFMVKNGYRVELVSPKSKESVVYGLLKRYGNSPYHICYICDDMDASLRELQNKGYVQYDKAHEAAAFSNRKVCFLMHPYMGLIEILEEKECYKKQ